MAGRTVGRKTKLTKELRARFTLLLRKGLPRSVACQCVGIDTHTFYVWLGRARAGEPAYAAFLRDVETAQGEAQRLLLAKLRKHGNKHWQPIEWMLERVYRDDFGPWSQARTEFDKLLEQLMEVTGKTLSADDYTRLLKAIIDLLSGKPPEEAHR